MIVIHGASDSSSEYKAALRLAELASESIPRLAEDNKIHLDIIPHVQCFGQDPQDVDILVLFADYRENRLNPQSFCAAIEVKDHGPSDVSFEGATCIVCYRGKDHNATNQSEGQKYSVLNYIRANSPEGSSPFVTNLIWLRRVPSQVLPPQKNNIIGMDVSWPVILEKLSNLGGARPAFSSPSYLSATLKTFSGRLEPSHIDRVRLEAITRVSIDRSSQNYISKLGTQLLIFRGKGGTGKTVRLLQLAFYAYSELGLRVILLTYNKALVADLKRLLALMKIKNSIGGEGVAVRTIHGFVHDWAKALGLLRSEDDFLERYEDLKDEIVEFIATGALSGHDLEVSKRDNSTSLMWDLLLVDEAQDWPVSERDLLYSLYDFRNVVLADGVDQFVRSTDKIDWRNPVDRSQTQIIPLRKSLRLKAGLCQTVSDIAESLEYSGWNLQPLPESYGGRVLIVLGDMADEQFHRNLLNDARNDGNKPIDVLYCVPPKWVTHNDDGTRASRIKKQYQEWDMQVWDAVDDYERDSFPTSLEQVRVVQYDSCRGLEGWTVVNCGLDEFYEYKKSTVKVSEHANGDLFFDEEQAALDYARRWLMIPLTRAIDTLIIHLTDRNSDLGKVLMTLLEENPEAIELIEL